MALAALTRETLQSLIGQGFVDQDFATLLVQQAKAAGLPLEPENVPVSDGLS
jgi:3-hydroxyisobutyrate dehydrogenase